MAVFAMAMLPRGKFLRHLVLTTFAVCLAGAVSMLALWSAVKARINTAPETAVLPRPGTRVPYNASQSAVLGIWLFFSIFFVNSLRARFPSLAIPSIVYSIFVDVACTSGVTSPTVASAEALVCGDSS